MMTELGRVVRDDDWNELEDAQDRVVTEEYLRGRRSWPLDITLPLKRFPEGEGPAEVGYAIRGPGGGEVEPVVYQTEGPTRVRHYASIEQLVEAGWRAD